MDLKENEIRKYYLDLLFSIFLILLLGAFFWASTGYSWASKRAPLFVMVPLAVMVVVRTWLTVSKIYQLRSSSNSGKPGFTLDARDVTKASQILIWLVLLLVFFYIVGHLGGTALFLFVFIKYVSRETMRTAFLVAIGVTASIYVLFEKILMISLYEGWIYFVITGWLYS